jgi:hypothetical protein
VPCFFSSEQTNPSVRERQRHNSWDTYKKQEREKVRSSVFMLPPEIFLSMLCNPNPRMFLFFCLFVWLVGCCGIYSFRFLSVEPVSDGDCGSGLDNSFMASCCLLPLVACHSYVAISCCVLRLRLVRQELVCRHWVFILRLQKV